MAEAKDAAPASPFADPDLCNRCGQCCHVPTPHGPMRRLVCTHLEADGNVTRCGVWDTRGAVDYCRSAQFKAAVGQLPKSCPYVRDDPTYTANFTYPDPFLEGISLIQFKPHPALKMWNGPLGLDLCPPEP